MMVKSPHTLIVFIIDSQRYGVDLRIILRVVRVVEITPVPGMPEKVMGIINVEGTLIPVISSRKLLNSPEKEPELSDQLVIFQLPERVTALLVDGVEGVIKYTEADEISMESVIPGTKILKGILRNKEDLIFIQDIEKFLSPEETRTIDSVLKNHVRQA